MASKPLGAGALVGMGAVVDVAAPMGASVLVRYSAMGNE